MPPPIKDRRGRPRRARAPVPRPPKGDDALPTFEAVVEAAEDLLERIGIDGLTTNRVAERAGVSIGSIYRYFPNKEAIVAGIFVRNLSVMTGEIIVALDSSTSLTAVIGEVATRLVALTKHRPRMFAHLWRLRTAADVHDEIAKYHELLIEATTALVQRVEPSYPGNPRAFAFTLVHASDGIANALALYRDQEPMEIAIVFERMVSAFLATVNAR